LDAIGSLTPASSVESPDIRLFCDNDDAGPGKRWQLVPDIEDASIPVTAQNCRKSPQDQQWWDHINKLYREPGDTGCQDKTVDTFAYTFDIRVKGEKAAGQNINREVIVVCAID